MKKIIIIFQVYLVILFLVACTKQDREILLSTTTSTENSGLLDYLLPYFEKDANIKVKVIAVGTGAALERGRTGDADILIVHDQLREEQFMIDGYGSKRSDLMYNDFVLVGPKSNQVNHTSLENVLKYIHENNLLFISRGDASGTHAKELSLWKKYNIKMSGDYYLESGQGMSETLMITNEKKAYTLVDRATFLTMEHKLDLKIVFQNDESLYNQYGVILINPDKHKNIKIKEAEVFYNWLISERGQNLINQFGKKEFNQSLFVANASKE